MVKKILLLSGISFLSLNPMGWGMRDPAIKRRLQQVEFAGEASVQTKWQTFIQLFDPGLPYFRKLSTDERLLLAESLVSFCNANFIEQPMPVEPFINELWQVVAHQSPKFLGLWQHFIKQLMLVLKPLLYDCFTSIAEVEGLVAKITNNQLTFSSLQDKIATLKIELNVPQLQALKLLMVLSCYPPKRAGEAVVSSQHLLWWVQLLLMRAVEEPDFAYSQVFTVLQGGLQQLLLMRIHQCLQQIGILNESSMPQVLEAFKPKKWWQRLAQDCFCCYGQIIPNDLEQALLSSQQQRTLLEQHCHLLQLVQSQFQPEKILQLQIKHSQDQLPCCGICLSPVVVIATTGACGSEKHLFHVECLNRTQVLSCPLCRHSNPRQNRILHYPQFVL